MDDEDDGDDGGGDEVEERGGEAIATGMEVSKAERKRQALNSNLKTTDKFLKGLSQMKLGSDEKSLSPFTQRPKKEKEKS